MEIFTCLARRRFPFRHTGLQWRYLPVWQDVVFHSDTLDYNGDIYLFGKTSFSIRTCSSAMSDACHNNNNNNGFTHWTTMETFTCLARCRFPFRHAPLRCPTRDRARWSSCAPRCTAPSSWWRTAGAGGRTRGPRTRPPPAPRRPRLCDRPRLTAVHSKRPNLQHSNVHVLTKRNIWERERNVLFNDALNTFYLQLYGVRHMVKDHSDSEKGNPLPPHRLLLSWSTGWNKK